MKPSLAVVGLKIVIALQLAVVPHNSLANDEFNQGCCEETPRCADDCILSRSTIPFCPLYAPGSAMNCFGYSDGSNNIQVARCRYTSVSGMNCNVNSTSGEPQECTNMNQYFCGCQSIYAPCSPCDCLGEVIDTHDSITFAPLCTDMPGC